MFPESSVSFSTPKMEAVSIYETFVTFLPANTDIMTLTTVRSTGNEFFGSHAGLVKRVLT